jgi:hypothetical protein
MSGKQRKRGVKKLCVARGKEELNRLLIAQFYEDSIRRYGNESEEARRLSQVLSLTDFDASKKRLAELARTNALPPPAPNCRPICIDRSSHDCRQTVSMSQKTRIEMDRTPELFLTETPRGRREPCGAIASAPISRHPRVWKSPTGRNTLSLGITRG